MNSHLIPYLRWAQQALLYEVALTPKPGLVDRWDTGSHDDMDFNTFMASCASLYPHLQAYLTIGYNHQGSPLTLFEQLRQEGILAEKTMMAATHGINTHKGANFSFAVLLGSLGQYLAHHSEQIRLSSNDLAQICSYAQLMTQHLPHTDLAQLTPQTALSHGETLYVRYGIQGPRGEAAAGFPTLIQKALPYLRQELASNQQTDYALLQTLVYLMSIVEDGNLIHRGGLEGLQKVQTDMQCLHEAHLDYPSLVTQLHKYNTELIQQHLSPGGSADLLALTIFFALCEGILV